MGRVHSSAQRVYYKKTNVIRYKAYYIRDRYNIQDTYVTKLTETINGVKDKI